MRIAIVCTDLGVRIPDERKGAAIHLLSLANAFARAGHDVLLVGVAGHGPAPAGIQSLLYPHPGRSEGLERERRKLAFVERVAGEAVERVARFAPDVVYERLALFGDAGRRLAGALGVPHAVEVNALLAREEAEWRGLRLRSLARQRERRVLEQADLCVAVSDELLAQLRADAPGARALVVANGVETQLFGRLPGRAQARRLLGLPSEPRLATFVGALRPWHGVDVAIDALRFLPDGVHLAIAGDGPERTRLAAAAEDAGLAARIHWLGQRPHAEIPVVLAAADVALLPYPPLARFAFSPLKLYEYLAAGVPVVASDLGQVREALADGEHGTLVPAGDAKALARGIVVGLGDLARERAARARVHALRAHGWDARAETIAAALAAAVEERKHAVLAR